MKKLLFSSLFALTAIAATAQQKGGLRQEPDPKKPLLTVEASCGQCQLGLPGKDCDLAIRLDSTAYYVDGTSIDEHGDAHAKEGFCNAVRKAQVQGEVVNGRFKATYFKLLPAVVAKAAAH